MKTDENQILLHNVKYDKTTFPIFKYPDSFSNIQNNYLSMGSSENFSRVVHDDSWVIIEINLDPMQKSHKSNCKIWIIRL